MKIRSHFKSSLILLLFFGLTAYHLPPTETPLTAAADGFIWHDLVTPDMEASRSFYGAVFGWEFKIVQTRGLKVGTIYSGATPIGGVIEVPGANSAVWIKAMLVTGLKERVSLAENEGGKVLLPAAKIPGRGVQVIMEGASGEEFSFIGEPESILQAGSSKGEHQWLWSELWADDPESSVRFYENVFQVTTNSTTSGGNPYWVFNAGTQPVAGMIKNPITNQGTQWVPYVLSSDPEAAVERASGAGAFIVMPPSPQVRDGRVGVVQDPLGAMICIQKQ